MSEKLEPMYAMDLSRGLYQQEMGGSVSTLTNRSMHKRDGNAQSTRLCGSQSQACARQDAPTSRWGFVLLD
jgi:hypothetical protein